MKDDRRASCERDLGERQMSTRTERAPILGSRDIRQVMAVADRGSIRRASEVLGMTQPGLSKNLRLIEDRLGVALFERSTAGVKLTSAGKLLVERGRQVLLDLAAIEGDIDESASGDTGSLTVGPVSYTPLTRPTKTEG